MKKSLTLLFALFWTLSGLSQDKIVLRLMGDSTMADKDLSYSNPERGWGQRLKSCFDDDVLVVNYAQNGRSTKSIQTAGIWSRVKSDLKANDYLLIQFGHNDSKINDTTVYAAAFGAYQDNLRMFINHALSVGAKPVLLTPASRRAFDKKGTLRLNDHGDYPEAVRQVAREYGLPLIDATEITQNWLMNIGEKTSRQYYVWLEKGVSPKHPEGKNDNTHTNVAGARKLAELFLPSIVEIIPELGAHVKVSDFVVAKDGTGDFLTIQEAINASPDYCSQKETLIYIKNGLYKEKVIIPSNKQNVHLVGQSPQRTIITWSDIEGQLGSTGCQMPLVAASTVFLLGDNCILENLLIENFASKGKELPSGPAVTLGTDSFEFINCRFFATPETVQVGK